MDKKAQPLLETALAAVRAHGLDAAPLARAPKPAQAQAAKVTGRVDATVKIGHGRQATKYTAEIKHAVTPALLGGILQQIAQLPQPALLVTDYVTPPMADRLREAGIEFIDAAGNVYLNQPPLLVWVKGQKPMAKPVAPEVGRAFQPGGLQVLFVLLCDPAAVNLPYRELAARAGVAHGTVGWVMADLALLRYLMEGKGRRLLQQKPQLLNQWAEAYARTLRPRTLLGRYYVDHYEGWKDWPLPVGAALWGGEPAGAILTGYLRPGELTLYVEKPPAMLIAKQKLMKHAEPGRTAVVELRKRFWHFNDDAEKKHVTPPLLVYADLLATGDSRCIETAKLIYDEHLARLVA